MSEVIVSLFRKVIILIVVCSFFMGIFTQGFNLLSNIMLFLPDFAFKYGKLALVAFVFTIFKRMLAED